MFFLGIFEPSFPKSHRKKFSAIYHVSKMTFLVKISRIFDTWKWPKKIFDAIWKRAQKYLEKSFSYGGSLTLWKWWFCTWRSLVMRSLNFNQWSNNWNQSIFMNWFFNSIFSDSILREYWKDISNKILLCFFF